MSQPEARISGYMWIVAAYVFALIVAVVAIRIAPFDGFIAKAFFADVMATLAIFAFSFLFKNSSFYDAYWSVAPPVLVLYWAVSSPQTAEIEAGSLRLTLAFGLMLVWAIRLTYNWARGWTGLDHEDWRYRDKQSEFPRAYWAVSLGGIHMVPTVQVFLGCLPLYYVATHGGSSLGPLDFAAVTVTLVGITFETVADKQLHDFVSGPRKPGEILTTGLWRFSRHPNYFGEITFWWGMALFGLAAVPDKWFQCLIGAAGITVLFLVVSLGLIERRSLERRPGYEDVIRSTSALIPWFPKS